MPDTTTQILPLLPLKEGVILPHMVVTISVDSDSSDESFEAIAAARRGDGYVLLVPRIDDKYASIGTVAKLEDSQKAGLPDTEDVLIVRGLHRAVDRRARRGQGYLGSGRARAGPVHLRRAWTWPRSTAPLWRTSCRCAASAAWPASCGASKTPATWPTRQATLRT